MAAADPGRMHRGPCQTPRIDGLCLVCRWEQPWRLWEKQLPVPQEWDGGDGKGRVEGMEGGFLWAPTLGGDVPASLGHKLTA